MRPSFASESSTNALSLSLVIHLHDSPTHNTRWLIIWPDRASNFDTSDPMRNVVLTPVSGPNSASSTYFRSHHAHAILDCMNVVYIHLFESLLSWVPDLHSSPHHNANAPCTPMHLFPCRRSQTTSLSSLDLERWQIYLNTCYSSSNGKTKGCWFTTSTRSKQGNCTPQGLIQNRAKEVDDSVTQHPDDGA